MWIKTVGKVLVRLLAIGALSTAEQVINDTNRNYKKELGTQARDRALEVANKFTWNNQE